tara:strand:- start:181 stop:1773 length:1593 start_codon:yes stop_codon:yes gene_type:complete
MSNGIAPNPLNAISKVYLETVAKESAVPGKPAEKLKTDRDMFNIPKDEQQAAKERLLAKTKAKRAAKMEALDPVGKEDGDVNNDGKKDSTDSYLLKRRKAIGKAMKKKMSEAKNVHGNVEVPDKNLSKMSAKATKRVDTDVDGDVEHNDKSKGEYGEFVPSPTGKKKVTTKMEGSNWRADLSDLIEVAPMTDDEASKPIKEKKVKNVIKINPKLGEAVEEMGGQLIEMIEIDEFDFVVESVYSELLEEGYSEDDVEFGIETALNSLDEDYYAAAAKASREKAKTIAKSSGAKSGKSMKDRLKSAAKSAIMGAGRAVGKAAKTARAVQAAPGKAKAKVKSLADRVKSVAKAGYDAGREKPKASTEYRGAGVGRKEKIGEEVSPEDKKMLAKKKQLMTKQQMLDKQRLQAQMQGKIPTGHASSTQTREEVEVVDERTRYAKETGKDFKTGNPSEKGGTRDGTSVFDKVSRDMRKTGGVMSSRGKAIQPQGKKKVPGKKGYQGVTPVDKIRNKLSQKRAPKPNPYKARAGESD